MKRTDFKSRFQESSPMRILRQGMFMVRCSCGERFDVNTIPVLGRSHWCVVDDISLGAHLLFSRKDVKVQRRKE